MDEACALELHRRAHAELCVERSRGVAFAETPFGRSFQASLRGAGIPSCCHHFHLPLPPVGPVSGAVKVFVFG